MSPEADRKRDDAERDAVERLANVLREAGWQVEVEPAAAARDRPDLLALRGRLRYVVEVKAVREARRPLIQAMFASAILQARAYAAGLRGRPLAIIAAPRISPRVAQEIGDYARRFAPEVAWGVLDAGPTLELHGEGFEGIAVRPAARAARRTDPLSRRRANPLTDLGQWMLKVLLAPRLALGHLAAPRAQLMSASHLARTASVSLPSAARFLEALRELGFLDRGPRELRVVRLGDLLQTWRAMSAGPAEEVRTRWLIPPQDSATHLERILGGVARSSAVAPGARARGAFSRVPALESRVCLGLFAAGARLGFRFVHGAPLHIFLEDVSRRNLEALGLAPAEAGQGFDVVVRRPAFPEAVFRSCVVRDGVAAADLLQCWLDVSHHPARGQELADRIWRRVLAPRLMGEVAS